MRPVPCVARAKRTQSSAVEDGYARFNVLDRALGNRRTAIAHDNATIEGIMWGGRRNFTAMSAIHDIQTKLNAGLGGTLVFIGPYSHHTRYVSPNIGE